MSKIKIKVNTDLSVIKSQLRKDERFSQGVRLYAVYQIAKGKDAKELVELYSSSHKSICNWVHRYNAEGVDGLKDRLRSGRPPLLNEIQRLELEKIILASPLDYGYTCTAYEVRGNTATWTGALAIDIVKRKFGVEYKKAQILRTSYKVQVYNILHSLNFSFQKGKGYYPETEERTEEEVEKLKKSSKL